MEICIELTHFSSDSDNIPIKEFLQKYIYNVIMSFMKTLDESRTFNIYYVIGWKCVCVCVYLIASSVRLVKLSRL